LGPGGGEEEGISTKSRIERRRKEERKQNKEGGQGRRHARTQLSNRCWMSFADSSDAPAILAASWLRSKKAYDSAMALRPHTAASMAPPSVPLLRLNTAVLFRP